MKTDPRFLNIESKIIFPVSRAFFLLIALICLGATLIFLILLASSWSSAPEAPSVNPQVVIDATKPMLTTSKSPGSPLTTSKPAVESTSEAQTPTQKLYFSLLESYGSRRTQEVEMTLAEKLDDYIFEAESAGDDRDAYVANGTEVATATNGTQRIQSFKVYHQRRLMAVREYREAVQKAEENTKRNMIAVAVAFLGLLQISLVLALLAIERNTRSDVERTVAYRP